MRGILRKVLIYFVSIILITGLTSSTYASEIDLNNINSDDLEKYLKGSNLEASEIVEMYTELTEQYSNQDIANMIDKNKDEIIKKSGIDEQSLNTGTTILRSLDTEETKKILEDLDIDEIQEKLENGYTVSQIVEDIQEQMSTTDKLSIATRLLLASSIVRTALTVLGVLTLYMIIIRWIIFRKAQRHGWASIIPIYNEITYLKICGISPWWILILLIPIIGWLIYGIIKIIARFTLADSFGRGIGFGFGLLILGIIFESVLAFDRNIEYIGDEE